MCKKTKEEVTLYNLLDMVRKAMTNAQKWDLIRAYLLQRTCLVCAKKLQGRSDKIYCGIQCKNKYHAAVRSSTKGIRGEMMKTLMKNYFILEGILGEHGEEAEVSQTQLAREGFQFDHVTNVRHEGGCTRYRVFNRSYELVDSTKVRIFRNADESSVSPLLFVRWEKKFLPFKTIRALE